MSDSRLLEGKVAVISGAASPRGIGMATARMFAKHGAKVAILDLDEAQAKEAAGSIGAEHRGYACNVTDRQACDDAVAKVVADFGSIDVLINNAGITQAAKFLDIDSQSWDRILDVNLRGVLYLSQAVVPQMKKQKSGSIGCMSSVSAQRGGGILGGPHYSAAKAGVLGLAKAMARELGGEGIRVNCVTPGLIQTDINAGKIPDDKRGEILAGIPAGRLGVPDDVAGAFLFLAADISSYITGAVIDVNGGMLIHG
ncbi:short-chain dehydrogenase/reductase SDR [Caballeronia arationis]|jgi:NAD(P)-dependent dehydrogenase (short-subunit alcohol dehydrogenase family)|uniref:NAD(P)-dependent dehydrogenase, short-chain alcohol dehydrogenase family n=1 Tax=Caballeronia arationis TaxID=1777142 RepID=A0A7Z7N167_9BURK|nr:glucose 1-dehydrogenase [Caballeronia arationis]SAL02542.1 short-chain dehydrogenase/reductase SDR [Caballeronia arationis]SOE54820.1 NAD(P)-dependent dehydrogenase, short-chain alcohol dehydrogenase family [Caballeronia arationis]